MKPENIFVTTDGRVKILDFGLAKLVGTHDIAQAGASVLPTSPGTQPGLVLGTVGYMAPEQVRGVTADHRCDLFALGAVLYEMLAGRRAFARETATETMTAILRKEPPELSAPDRQIPPALERIVGRCLEKSPAARFQTASDLAFALDGLTPSRSGGVPAMAAGLPDRRRERRAWTAAAIALIVAGALAVPATGYLRRPRVEPPEMRLDIATPPTDDPASFAISPDGRRFVFTSVVDGKTQLWIRALDAVSAQPVPGTENGRYPFWAFDGRAIGFFATGKVERLDLVGGTVQAIGTASSGWGGTWNDEGTILFGATSGASITRITAAGGPPVPVTKLDPPRQTAHRFPRFLPDGRHFLYYSAGNAEGVGVYVGSLDTVSGRRLFSADSGAVYVPPGFLLFVRQGNLLAQRFNAATMATSGEAIAVAERVAVDPMALTAAVSAARDGSFVYRSGVSVGARRLVWLDRSGTTVGTVAADDRAFPSNIELSPDGTHLALDRMISGNRDVWVIDLTRNVDTRFYHRPGARAGARVVA